MYENIASSSQLLLERHCHYRHSTDDTRLVGGILKDTRRRYRYVIQIGLPCHLTAVSWSRIKSWYRYADLIQVWTWLKISEDWKDEIVSFTKNALYVSIALIRYDGDSVFLCNYTRCIWKVRTDVGHEFHIPKQEKCPYQRVSGNI
jgi:hypothetical protein